MTDCHTFPDIQVSTSVNKSHIHDFCVLFFSKVSMASITLYLFLSIAFTQFSIGIALISWNDCEQISNDIKLLNLTIDPDPIMAPGIVSITFTIDTDQNITSPLKV